MRSNRLLSAATQIGANSVELWGQPAYKRSGVSRRSLCALLAAVAVVLATAVPATASQQATSSRGVGAYGTVSGSGGYELPGPVPRAIGDVLHPVLEPYGITWPDGRWIPRRPVLAPNGEEVRFDVAFVDPTRGEMTYRNEPLRTDGLTSPDPNIDLRKPIALFAEQQMSPTSPQENWSAKCYVKFNPTSYSDGTPGVGGPGALDDIWFDVTGCKDGLPYDFYRVHFYQDPTYGNVRNGNPLLGAGGPHWSGRLVMYEVSAPAVCGHKRDGTWDCYTNPGAPPSSNSGHIYSHIELMRGSN